MVEKYLSKDIYVASVFEFLARHFEILFIVQTAPMLLCVVHPLLEAGFIVSWAVAEI